MGTYAVDMIAMFFGMPNSLLPAIAVRFGGPAVFGVLLAAPAVGSFLAVATSGWAKPLHKHGLAVPGAAPAWGVALLGIRGSPNLPPAFGLPAPAGRVAR